MEINLEFKKLRKELKVTQAEAAAMLDVSRVTYSKWELEPKTMPLGMLLKVNEKLNKLKEMRNGLDTSSN